MGFGKFDKEEPVDAGIGHLMCVARGCPNRWSVDAGNGRLCSRHAWKSAVEWPSITEDIKASPYPTIPAEQRQQISAEEKLDILRKVEQMFSHSNPKRWAHALKERESRGERLTSFQKSSWREALGVRE
jgi:hypothetical protein